ncbi:uncharacterized protein DUF4159 [Nonlabens dokdonensis]|jgi:hypothetical protein|uniref:DUF4159 domain-containing protein n=2 Tax=Nonlabens dokdonensis TaxID=328515 RepID=L7WCB5_NONDD|nr:DUF4159 domain-containing protein [Nonlabens dokdonensis]AGC77581.1 hypothetical protein DDD_2454 [Nonlabens dokdonensis DSW-6]PZX39868.1 uncharacterized protein DUF4159 [Nonlabens dokdonensis]
MRNIIYLIALLFISVGNSQQLAVLKYDGGGDWYSNPTAVPNLIAYCNDNLGTNLEEEVATVEASSVDIFQYPFIHMTGHGNVVFNTADIENIRNYLLSGGFLHIDDNYGMEPYLNKELIKLFPQKELVELPATHPIFNIYAKFPKGLPKIHEHEGKRPQAKGLFHEGRLVLLFTYESDLGDGWESPEVHNDPPEVRKKALDMGANIIKYVFTN